MIINETTVKWLEEQQSRLKTRKWFSEIDMPEFGKKFKSPVSVMGQIIFWTTLQESKIPEKLFEKVKMLKSSTHKEILIFTGWCPGFKLSVYHPENYISLPAYIFGSLPNFLMHCLESFWFDYFEKWEIFQSEFSLSHPHFLLDTE